VDAGLIVVAVSLRAAHAQKKNLRFESINETGIL